MKYKEEKDLLTILDVKKGRFYCTHKSKHDGRRQTLVWIIIKNKCYLGQAQCSKLDTFDKSKGRVIALGRAFKRHFKDDPLDKIPEFLEKKNDRK